MPKKAALLFAVYLFFQAGPCFALDVKKLNEQADRTSLNDALSSVRSFPDSPDTLYVLGVVYLNLHRDKEAGDVFNKISTLYPGLPEVKWGLAEVMRRHHKLDESKSELEAVIKSNPRFAPAYISLAYIKHMELDFNGSLKLANSVLGMGKENVDPGNYVRALVLTAANKGMLAHYGGLLSKVINGSMIFSILKKAQKLKPDSAAVMFGLGSFYLLAPTFAGGRPEEAEKYLERAIEIDPLFADMYVRLSQFHKIKGDTAKYKLYLDRALEIDPGNELALDVKSGRCKFICPGQ